MYISHSVRQAYEIKNMAHEILITPKNFITNIANRILKHTSLITAMIQVGIVFSLAHPVQGHVLPDNEIPITTTTPELDEVISVAINNLNINEDMMCGNPLSLC